MPIIYAPAPSGGDDRSALQGVIDTYSTYPQFDTGGVEIVLDRGIYRVGASLDLTGRHGVHIRGQGMHATEIRALGNFPVVTATGSSGAPLNQASLKGMTIRGYGHGTVTGPETTYNNAHGIALHWTNRCAVEDIMFYGCRIGIYLTHAWQTTLTNLQAAGQNEDRCHQGVFLGASDSNFIDNAVIASGCMMQQCLYAGFRIVNGQGSKFTSCEAGGDGTKYGWYIGDTISNLACQWMHIDNCLADSVEVGWLIEANNHPLGEMILTSLWTGNSADAGMIIRNAADLQVNGLIAITHSNQAIRLEDCTRISISQVTARQYNNSNNGSSCILLHNSTACTVSNITAYSSHDAAAVRETGTSDQNLIATVSNQPELIGANSQFVGAGGDYGGKIRAAGNATFSVNSGSNSTSYLGLGPLEAPLKHCITAYQPGNAVEVYVDGGSRLKVGTTLNSSSLPFQVAGYTTAGRPSASPAGQIIYDTTLGKLVYSTGSAWTAVA
jgi:hypothetical protein